MIGGMETPQPAATDRCANCLTCLDGQTMAGLPVSVIRMVVCPQCGNKRCPHASDHRLACTGSNEPGQPGSRY